MAKSPVVLPLPFCSSQSSPSQTPQPASQAKAESPQLLWLALVFPQLALEIHMGSQQDIAAVLVKEHKGRSIVHSVSSLAQQQGIKMDMPINAAYALSPGLKVYPVNEQVEQNRLQQLAVWAEQFTSKVSLQSPQALLLEVRGSMKLFGGLPNLKSKIHQQLNGQWQHSFISAITPTPLASLLLARSGHTDIVTSKDKLRSVLGRLSINNLPIGLKKKQQLHNTGVRLLRDVWRLPKDGLARRFGPKLVHHLDRTLGLIPDPLDFFTSLEVFEAFYEFPLEIHKTDLLLNIASQLLEQLAIFLRERDICINQCEFQLHHEQSTTHVIIGVRQASRDHQHLTALLQEQLDQLSVEASVRSITLTAKDFLPFVPEDSSLFLDSDLNQQFADKENNIDRLLEQLLARLGRDAIKTIHSVDDHRPEYAYCFNQVAKKQSEKIEPQRPFWLLPEPQRIPQKDNKPWLRGPVSLLKGPERIEAGWWSGHDVRRDYYIALDNKGSHLWIFQEFKQKHKQQHKEHQWYLHGIFA
jgi:protein ImuB